LPGGALPLGNRAFTRRTENIALEVRYTDGRSDRAADLASELVQLGVDVIVTHYTQTTRAAMAATKTIPIVMVVGAPVQRCGEAADDISAADD